MKRLFILLVSASILIACSKEKKLTRRLDGVWDANGMLTINNGSSYIQFSGTIELKKDGSGIYNFLFDNGYGWGARENEIIRWSNSENTVTITGNPKTFLASVKVWTVIENGKEYQTWTASNGLDSVELTITKKY